MFDIFKTDSDPEFAKDEDHESQKPKSKITTYSKPAANDENLLAIDDNSSIACKDFIQQVHGQIMDDSCDIMWMLLRFTNTAAKGRMIYLAATGKDYDDFLGHLCVDTHVAYGYARIRYTTKDGEADETSALIFWVGKDTKLAEKAEVSHDRDAIEQMLRDHDKVYVTGKKSEIAYKRITFNAQLATF